MAETLELDDFNVPLNINQSGIRWLMSAEVLDTVGCFLSKTEVLTTRMTIFFQEYLICAL